MSMPPVVALSVRQPWAWAIIHAGKDIENRSQAAVSKGSMRIRPIAIHASKGMTREEYESAASFMTSIGVTCPPPADLARGGIIGAVAVAGIVRSSASPWFFGPCGLVLVEPRPCAFIPARGELGFFEWREGKPEDVPAPARWMLKHGAVAELPIVTEQSRLL
jgi:hypothetical protein